MELSASLSGGFTPRERVAGTHWIGGWVGRRAVLDALVVKRKIPSPRRESTLEPRCSFRVKTQVSFQYKIKVKIIVVLKTQSSQ